MSFRFRTAKLILIPGADKRKSSCLHNTSIFNTFAYYYPAPELWTYPEVLSNDQFHYHCGDSIHRMPQASPLSSRNTATGGIAGAMPVRHRHQTKESFCAQWVCRHWKNIPDGCFDKGGRYIPDKNSHTGSHRACGKSSRHTLGSACLHHTPTNISSGRYRPLQRRMASGSKQIHRHNIYRR